MNSHEKKVNDLGLLIEPWILRRTRDTSLRRSLNVLWFTYSQRANINFTYQAMDSQKDKVDRNYDWLAGVHDCPGNRIVLSEQVGE